MIRQESNKQTIFNITLNIFHLLSMVFPSCYNGLAQGFWDMQLGISLKQMVQVLGTGSSPPTQQLTEPFSALF